MLGYNYIKNYYRLIAVLSRQKELDADPKTIQQMECVRKLKNEDGINSDGTQSIFILTIKKNEIETRLTFSQGSVAVL